MKDASKTNQERIAEISVLKKRIRELEQTSSEKIRGGNERRARQLTVLHETSVELTAELSLDTLLHSIAQRALNLIGGAACNCYLYNPQTDLMERVVSAGTALVPSPKARQRGEGMVGQVWVKGTPLLVNDYASWSGRTRAYDSFPSRALVAAPFRWGTEILGILNIMAPLPHQYTQMDVEMLSLFAAQAAIAIRNAQLHDRMKMELEERKLAEEALRQSETKYQFLAESMADVVFTLDMNLVTTYVSPSIERMLGYTPEERIAQKVDQQLTLKSQKSVFETLAAELDREKEKDSDPDRFRTLELEYYHKDGSVKHLVTYIRGIRDSEGNLTGFYGSHHDITDRKRAEEALRLITDNMSDMIRVTDLQGVNLYVSPSHVKILGYTPEERLGKSGFDIVHPDDLEYIINVFSQGLSHKKPAKVEYRIKHAEGHYIWLETIGDQLNNDHGEMTAVIMSSRDITDRKLTEKQLQDTLESLRKAINTTIQAMVSAVETRDPYTSGHQIRSADLARAIATEMGLSPEKIEGIRMAGSIHDIGKLSIPAEILSKPTKLSELEFALIKEHARKGYEMLKDVESPWPLAEIVRQHHERIDGSGYPRNLKGDDIIMEARILAVADVVEAMASHRPYRPGLGIDAALNEIEKNSGIFYDAAVANACLRLFREKGYKLEGT